jgi:hypothetical protein
MNEGARPARYDQLLGCVTRGAQGRVVFFNSTTVLSNSWQTRVAKSRNGNARDAKRARQAVANAARPSCVRAEPRLVFSGLNGSSRCSERGVARPLRLAWG